MRDYVRRFFDEDSGIEYMPSFGMIIAAIGIVILSIIAFTKGGTL